MIPPWLIVRWRLVVAQREFVRWQIPIKGGARHPHPLGGCEEARRPQVDELWPASAAIAASTYGWLDHKLILAAASSVAVHRG
jgi:hypothetical protein